MTATTGTATRHRDAAQHATATQTTQAHRSALQKESRMKSLLSSKPTLWFLFVFNLVVAVAAGVAGQHIHIDGHTLHGSQQVVTAAGMGAVSVGAGAALFLKLRQRA